VGLPATLCGVISVSGLITQGLEILDHRVGREAIFFYGIPALVVAVVALGVSSLLIGPLRRQSKLASDYVRITRVVVPSLIVLVIVVQVLVNKYQTPAVSPVMELIGHDNYVTSVTFSPDGKTLASSSGDHSIRLWDMTIPSNDPVILTGHKDVVREVAFNSNGELLASGSDDRTILLWDLVNPSNAPVTLSGHDQYVHALTFTPDGNTLASCGTDIRLRDLSNPNNDPIVVWEESVLDCAFSPDGQLLAFSRDEIYVWNLNDPIGSYETYPMGNGQVLQVLSIDISPDGMLLAASAGPSARRAIHLWEIADFNVPPILLEGHTNTIGTVSFSPDGQLLASEGASSDTTVRIWNLGDPGEEPVIIRGAIPSDVAFSPDGKYLAVASSDGKIRLWDINELLLEMNR